MGKVAKGAAALKRTAIAHRPKVYSFENRRRNSQQPMQCAWGRYHPQAEAPCKKINKKHRVLVDEVDIPGLTTSLHGPMGLYITTRGSTNDNHQWYQWKYHYHRRCTITTGGKPGTNEPIANAATKPRTNPTITSSRHLSAA